MTNILTSQIATDPKFDHVRSMFSNDPATESLGATITHLDEHECDGQFTIRPDMCNGLGTAQGGFLFAFADSLFAGACNSTGAPTVAAQVSIHFIGPAHNGDVVHGEARESHTWGRNGITDVTLSVNGTVIAVFRGTSRSIGAVKT